MMIYHQYQHDSVFKPIPYCIISAIIGMMLIFVSACEKETVPTKIDLVSIKIDPNPMITAKGKKHTLKAIGIFKNGKSKDISDSVTWSSSDTGVAVIDQSDGHKYAKSLNKGKVTIIATSPLGISGTAELEVRPAELVSICVMPKDLSVQMGHVQQYTAKGIFSDGEEKDVTSRVNWSASNTSTPVISNTAGSKGLAISPPTGTITIFAEDPVSKIKGTTSLTVTTTKLVSIEVAPKTAKIPLGQDMPFTAIGKYVDGSTSDITSSVVWTLSNPSVASVNQNEEMRGVVTSLSVGKTSVKATDPAIIVSSSAELTVTPPELMSIRISPSDAIYLGAKQPLSATGVYSDASEKNLTGAVTFTSSDPSVALISRDHGSSKGIFIMPISKGITEITATEPQSGMRATIQLTINAPELVSISIKPSNPKILIGSQQTFTAIGTFADGKTKDITGNVTWTSSKPSVSRIAGSGKNKGLAISRNSGTAVIRASDPETGIGGKTVLYANPPKLMEILISPATPSVSAGDAIKFNATGKFNSGKTEDITNSVHWSTSKPSVLSIGDAPDQKGKATCLAPGQVVISAHAPDTDISGKATLTVNPAKLKAITLSSPKTSISLGHILPIYAKGLFADGTEKDITSALTYASSDPSIATLNAGKGKETSLVSISPGHVVIQASDPDTHIKSSLEVMITPSKLISISVSPENTSLSLSRNQRFSATGIYSDGNRKDMTEQVTWASSAPDIARISNANSKKGRVTALSEGKAIIRAVDPNTGIAGETRLTAKTFWQ